ncbi:MAG: DUF2807 domain-containing protein [Saprospiraceae bacterium]|nr:DUF2807 domain-containing protein [Saprospiraceae bacterium]
MKTITMKNVCSLICFVLLTVLTVHAQDDTRRLGDFESLEVSGGISVDLFHGSPKAEIEMIKGDSDKLKTEIKGNTLKIYFKNSSWGWGGGNGKAKIKLYFEDLNEVDVSAGSNVECNEVIKSTEFDADASSGARLELNLEAESVDSDVSSGASLRLEGNAKNLKVDVSSGASFRGSELKTKNVDADVSSGGSIKVWATDSLSADASSGGSVKYKGNPSKTNIDSGKYSGGSVRKMD